VREIAGALSAHIYAEEEVLCPAFASEIGEGVRDHALDLDSSLKLLLADLKGMEVGQSGFGAKLEQLMEVFYQHLSHEEHHMKPLREAVGDERLLEMGGRCVGLGLGLGVGVEGWGCGVGGVGLGVGRV